jgi:hypothetical protein
MAAVTPVPRPHALDEFEGHWVAVADGEVVAAGDTSDQLALRLLELQDERKRRNAVVEYVRPGSDAYIVGVG